MQKLGIAVSSNWTASFNRRQTGALPTLQGNSQCAVSPCFSTFHIKESVLGLCLLRQFTWRLAFSKDEDQKRHWQITDAGPSRSRAAPLEGRRICPTA